MVRRYAVQAIAVIVLVAAARPALSASEAAQERAQGDIAFVRFVNASPAAASLDLRLDGALVVQALAFGTATDIYVSVSAGPRIVEAVAGNGDGASVVAEVSIELLAGVAYDVAIVGLVDAAAIAAYPVDTSATGDGRARIRLIVCAPDASSVALAGLENDGAIEGIAFPDASEYTEIEAGGYDLTLSAVGPGQTVTLELSVAFDVGGIYDLFVVGLVADGSIALLLVRA